MWNVGTHSMVAFISTLVVMGLLIQMLWSDESKLNCPVYISQNICKTFLKQLEIKFFQYVMLPSPYQSGPLLTTAFFAEKVTPV